MAPVAGQLQALALGASRILEGGASTRVVLHHDLIVGADVKSRGIPAKALGATPQAEFGAGAAGSIELGVEA
jgi:hypothetical protein